MPARSRLLTGLLSGLMVLPLAASPAQAKSGISITAVLVGTESGTAGGIAVSAFGADDAAGRQRLCVQRLVGGVWRTVLCGHAELGTGGWVRTTVARSAHGKSVFRAVVQRIGRDGRPQPGAELESAPVSPLAASASALSSAPASVLAPMVSGPIASGAPIVPVASEPPATAVAAATSAVSAMFPALAVPAALAAAVSAGCAQPQTDSKSTVSLSRVDNGIETASVVRSK